MPALHPAMLVGRDIDHCGGRAEQAGQRVSSALRLLAAVDGHGDVQACAQILVPSTAASSSRR